MDLTVKGKDLTLNFGVRFVAELDRTKVIDGGHGITFGIGTVIAQEQLNMGSYEALVNVIRCALHDHNLTLDEVYATLDEQEDLDG